MSQSLSQLWIHIIFSTKKRVPFLLERHIRKRMHDYIASICLQQKCNPVIIGGVEDHIHLLVALHKNMTVSKLVEITKKASSKWIKESHSQDDLLKQFYWQKGYGAFSVSQSNLEIVKTYISKQEAHHKKFTFQDELRKLFNLHHVEYNEAFLWE